MMMTYVSYCDVDIADCIWASWGDWSTCTKTCGGGTQTRTRKVETYETKVGDCIGEPIEEQECNTGICPAGAGMNIIVILKYIKKGI